jgi:hypothetical protein
MTSLPEQRFILKGENPNQWIEKGLYFFSWEKTRKKGKSKKRGQAPFLFF